MIGKDRGVKGEGNWLRRRWAQLRVRIVALFGAIALVTYIYSGLTIYRTLQEDFPATQASDLASRGQQVLPQLEQAIIEGQEAATVLRNLPSLERYGGEVRLFDAEGREVYSTVSLTRDEDALQAALLGQEQTTTLTDQEGSERFVSVLLPVRQANEVLGVLELAASMQEVDRLSMALQPRLLVGLGFSMIAIAGAGVYLARNITRTLGEIEQAARHISQGSFQYRIEGGSNDEVGRLIGTVNEMARELQSLSETRARFLSNVSHELRTPLTIIKGFTVTLNQEMTVPDHKRMLEIIDEQTDHLTRLVDDLLTLSRLEAGGPPLETQKVDLNALGQQVWESLSARAKHEGIDLKFETHSSPVRANIDVKRLQQVLYNLLDNAFKHTPAGGQVLLRVTCQGDKAHLVVQDNGNGIPADKLPHIFDRFFQVVPGYRGAGLGLAVVKEVVEAHGAEVEVTSTLGEGTTFTVKLSAAEVNPHGG